MLNIYDHKLCICFLNTYCHTNLTRLSFMSTVLLACLICITEVYVSRDVSNVNLKHENNVLVYILL